MKKTLAILFVVILAMQGCQPDEEVSIEPVEVQFGFTLPGSSSNGRLASKETPASILVTIEDEEGSTILSNEEIELIPFGNSFASDPVQLSPGEYFLASFLVLSDGDTAVYAAPLEGSPRTDLVDDPLPIEFSVVENEVTNVAVEVLRIGDSDPSEFGYVSFMPIFVPTFQFEIVVFEADTINRNIQTTTADFIITSESDTLRILSLSAGVNLVTVPDGLANYTISITKEGFRTFLQSFALTELLIFQQGNPLEVILSSGDDSMSVTSGTFIDSGQLLGSAAGREVALGDLDGDGDLDAFIAGFSNFNIIWFNDGNGTFTDSGQSISIANDVELADLDGDGDLDAFLARSEMSNVVWFNDGNGFFIEGTQGLGSSGSFEVELGDLDNDGDVDAVIGNGNGDQSAIWLNDGTGNFSLAQNFGGTETTLGVALFDMNNDGFLDIITTGGSSSLNNIWYNDGTGSFNDSGISLANNPFTDLEVTDFNNDDLPDVIFAYSSAPNARVLINQGGNTFSSIDITPIPSLSSVGIGDFDNDGDMDFVATTNGAEDVVYFNNGTGDFTNSGQTFNITNSSNVLPADLNGDGILDLFFVRSGGHRVFFGQP